MLANSILHTHSLCLETAKRLFIALPKAPEKLFTNQTSQRDRFSFRAIFGLRLFLKSFFSAVSQTWNSVPPQQRVCWNALIFFLWFLPFFVLIAVTQWPYRELPFYYDSLGYGIVNTEWMVQHHSLFHPAHHDPGHAPLMFWALALAWGAFGKTVFVAHVVMWVFGAIFLAGIYRFCLLLFQGNRLYSIVCMLTCYALPQIYTNVFALTPDLPMVGFFFWMLDGFYRRKRLQYMVSLFLFSFTKANSYSILILFGGIHFIAIPLIAVGRFYARPLVLKYLFRRWLIWTNASVLGGIPVLIWIVASRIHQGFWFQAPIFKVSSTYHFTPEYLSNGFATFVYWALAQGQGNRGMAALVGVVLVLLAGVWAARRFLFRKPAPPLKQKASAVPQPLSRPYARWAILPPLMILGFLITVVIAAGEMRIERYFMPTILIFVLACQAVMFDFGKRIFAELNVMLSPSVSRILFTLGAGLVCALMLFNSVVRYDNRWPWRIPYMPEPVRLFFSNWGNFGYELNRQYIPFLEIKVKAIGDIEAAYKKNPNLRIVTNYPMNQAIAYRSAGFLAELDSIPSRSAYEVSGLFPDDLDLFIHVESMQSGTSTMSLETLKQVPELELFKQYASDDVWKTTVSLFRRKGSGLEVP